MSWPSLGLQYGTGIALVGDHFVVLVELKYCSHCGMRPPWRAAVGYTYVRRDKFCSRVCSILLVVGIMR
jgi:hypothetical protein